ncbi:DUF2087 domain-containing protein [Alkaliphilus hydrothermalis]|uniref:DUF2087 domain-containing protein n=1 Tax=Alkaliphilus hydrothermalis TaxID=1482730 RepID=A0ABS2NNE9_9FIRM|nr:hypothetical protein [Alkaliphilus hydrothermalis]
MKDLNEIFWNASVEELKQGFIYEESREEYICLICGKSFEKGIIYRENEMLMEASRAVKNHIQQEHDSVFDYLVNMNKVFTGLTEIQKELLKYFYQGLSDKEITGLMGGGSTSTIRNHRFKLKEKEKQAKIFSAIMGLLEEKDHSKEESPKKLVDIHKGAMMVDERYAVSGEEMEKVIKTYFTSKDGIERLKEFPAKEKRKIIVLKYMIKKFDATKKYSEKEVNQVLKSFYEDYVTLRRYLIQYGFMERSKDCSQYWLKN